MPNALPRNATTPLSPPGAPSSATTHSSAAAGAVRLRTAMSNLQRRLRSPGRDGGPSIAKLSALGQLHRAGALPAAELARREGVKPQTLTRLLAELEAEGWLARTPHPVDGRQSLLKLTRNGSAFLGREMRRRETALTAAIAAELSEPERALLRDACALIDRLADAMTSTASSENLS
ncbi:MAG: MarR family transcriptional regulator [Pseudomonadota bacterium]